MIEASARVDSERSTSKREGAGVTKSEFAGFPVRAIEEPVWVVGYSEPIIGKTTAWMRYPSRCLSRDAIYEVEGAIAPSDEAAITASAVQDTLRAAAQLSDDQDIELLAERTPRVSCIEPVDVPVLEVLGPSAEQQLDVRSDATVAPIHEDCRPFRRAITVLRAEGWDGAVLLPGLVDQVHSIVIPRQFAHEGRLRIRDTHRLPTPRPVIEYALGLNHSFPTGCWTSPTTLLTSNHAS
jgi:hypothetical protein